MTDSKDLREIEMKIECPKCKKEFNVLEKFDGKKAKCSKCHNIFIVKESEVKIQEISDVLITKTTTKKPVQSYLFKIWQNSPLAFRTAFLATLGVISALVISYYCMDWIKVINTPPKTKWLSEDVYSVLMLYSFAGEFDSIRNIRRELCNTISSNERMLVHVPKIFDPIQQRLEKRARALAQLTISKNDELNLTRNLYVDAMYAEADVFKEISTLSKSSSTKTDIENKVKKADDLAGEAGFALISIIFEIDPDMASSIKNLKK